MRRKDKEITGREEIDSLIRGCTVCHLSFAANNEPYGVPVSFGYDGRNLYIHTALAGKKIDFMEHNPRVSFSMIRNARLIAAESDPCRFTFGYESVVGSGTIHELKNPEEKSAGLNRIMHQYTGRQWSFESKALKTIRVWRIQIDALSGKRSGA